tara:strand:+ start:231 stop:767 length:537 start_codon:yes stop_codon:yes gene_type:complete
MPFTPGIKTAYKLSNDEGTMTYVGVTCNIPRRLREHSRWNRKGPTCTSSIFRGVFNVEELESYHCETQKEQVELERYYFDIYAETNVNKCTPGQTMREYRAVPANKAAQTAYNLSPARKASQAAYYAKPKNKAAKLAYMRKYDKDSYEKKVIRSVMDGMLDTLEAMHSKTPTAPNTGI